MKINVTEVGLEIQGLNTSELRVIAQALGSLANEAGSHQAYASEVAERLAGEIPQVIFNVKKYACGQCRTEFYEDEIQVELIGSREERVDTCPRCGNHYIQELRS